MIATFLDAPVEIPAHGVLGQALHEGVRCSLAQRLSGAAERLAGRLVLALPSLQVACRAPQKRLRPDCPVSCNWKELSLGIECPRQTKASTEGAMETHLMFLVCTFRTTLPPQYEL